MTPGFVFGVEPPSPPDLSALWFLFDQSALWVQERDGRAELAQPRSVPGGAHFLGTLEGRPCFCARVPQDAVPDALPLGLRDAFGAIPEPLWWIAARAVQILEWARTHRFCGSCGQPTVLVGADRSMRCEACRLSFYPRVAPAVICIVHRGKEALLARSKAFVRNWYSTLAGFVEPGESLEDTLAREIHEEVGVEIQNPRYFGSQPWPFPHSLMVGFTAEWRSGEIRIDDKEILDARWFHVDALPMIPPRFSIARSLIDWWVQQARSLP